FQPTHRWRGEDISRTPRDSSARILRPSAVARPLRTLLAVSGIRNRGEPWSTESADRQGASSHKRAASRLVPCANGRRPCTPELHGMFPTIDLRNLLNL